MTKLAFLFVFGLAAALLPAQSRTWIVDRHLGAGVDFKDIPPAITAARAGDRIEVRASAQGYSAFTLGKGLDVRADAGVLVPTIDVRGLTAAETAVVGGFTIGGDPPSFPLAGAVVVASCSGTVILRSLSVRTGARVYGANGSIMISDSEAVLLVDCVVHSGYGGPNRVGVRITNSRVTMQRCLIHGAIGNGAFDYLSPSSAGAAGLSCRGSHVVAAGVTLIAGTGGNGKTTNGPMCPSPGGNAVEGDGGILMAGCTLVRGAGGVNGCSPAPDGLAISGAFAVTSDCALTGQIGGGANIIAPLPVLSTRLDVVRGIPVTIGLRGVPGTIGLLFVDDRHRHELLPQIDGAFLLTPAAFPLGGVVLGSDGSGALALTVPRAAVERTLAFAQALTLAPSGRLAFTNVADFEIRAGATTR